jgi:hypothetical protein
MWNQCFYIYKLCFYIGKRHFYIWKRHFYIWNRHFYMKSVFLIQNRVFIYTKAVIFDIKTSFSHIIAIYKFSHSQTSFPPPKKTGIFHIKNQKKPLFFLGNQAMKEMTEMTEIPKKNNEFKPLPHCHCHIATATATLPLPHCHCHKPIFRHFFAPILQSGPRKCGNHPSFSRFCRPNAAKKWRKYPGKRGLGGPFFRDFWGVLLGKSAIPHRKMRFSGAEIAVFDRFYG